MVECLLCLQSEQEIEKCIQVDSTPWKEFGIKKLIDKHLWAIDTIKENSWLCSLCWEDLKVFHKFYNRIEEAHNVFKSLLKSETGTLQEDNKPKDLQLEMLLEPEIGHTLEPAIGIKNENKEPIVVPSTAITIKDETNKNDDVLLSDREFLDDPDFDDDFRFSCDDSDSDDDMPLIHRLNSDKTTDKSATESKSKSNDGDSMGRNGEDNYDEPTVVPSTATTIKYKTNKNDDVLLSDREFLDDPDFDDDFRFSCDDSYSDDDMPLIHRLKSGKPTVKSGTEEKSKSNDDSMGKNGEDKDNSESNPDPLQPNSESKKHRKIEYSCSKCGKFFGNKGNLKRHQHDIHHDIYAKVCKFCGQTITDSNLFKRHMAKHEMQFEKSKSKRSSNKFLQEHYKITCNKCHLPFDTFLLLCEHYREEHNERGFVTCCEIKFFDRFNLVDHINVHLNPEYFKCKVCGKVLAKRNSLLKHMKLHGEKKFQCDVCNKNFVQKGMLERHKLNHTSHRKIEYSCSKCGKFFGNKGNLKRHQHDIHLDIYAKVCKFCGQTITDSNSFKRHMEKHEMHSEIKSSTPSTTVKCGECGLILAGPLNLKHHRELQHPVDGKRDYTCNICIKISPALKKHIRCTHYKCTVCEKAFKRSDQLKTHMCTHTGTSLYGCRWCPKTFNTNNYMCNHARRAHPLEWEEARRQK